VDTRQIASFYTCIVCTVSCTPVYLAVIIYLQQPLLDDLHHVTVNAVKLMRTVEMYQWVETETKRSEGNL
jgi:hypothetical protein